MLSARQADGKPLRAHLLAAMKAGAPRPPQLDQPDLPDEFAHLLPWLRQLPCPLEWPALDSWLRVTGREIARWEADLLFRLDRVRQQ